eukprot:763258-Hanusia_phi.AAC.1
MFPELLLAVILKLAVFLSPSEVCCAKESVLGSRNEDWLKLSTTQRNLLIWEQAERPDYKVGIKVLAFLLIIKPHACINRTCWTSRRQVTFFLLLSPHRPFSCSTLLSSFGRPLSCSLSSSSNSSIICELRNELQLPPMLAKRVKDLQVRYFRVKFECEVDNDDEKEQNDEDMDDGDDEDEDGF